MTLAWTRWRGQPVALLLILVIGWVGMRTAVWENPLPRIPDLIRLAERGAEKGALPVPTGERLMETQRDLSSGPTGHWPVIGEKRDYFPAALMPSDPPSAGFGSMLALQQNVARPPADHSLLFLAGLSYVPLPDAASLFWASPQESGTGGSQLLAPNSAELAPGLDRWSLDMWAFVRSGRSSLGTTGLRPASYGATQAGGVLRYRLGDAAGHRPSAYLRSTAAPGSSGAASQTEAAFGLSARPLPRLPMAAYAEMRASRSGGRTRLRPAGFIVSEFPPVKLPMGARGTAYAQAGYVGGASSSAFVDGQMRIERQIADTPLGQVHLGGGAWGGAQRDAARLDVGPGARLETRLGDQPIRLDLDYRMQIAGNAEPGSGLALTLSAGF